MKRRQDGNITLSILLIVVCAAIIGTGLFVYHTHKNKDLANTQTAQDSNDDQPLLNNTTRPIAEAVVQSFITAVRQNDNQKANSYLDQTSPTLQSGYLITPGVANSGYAKLCNQSIDCSNYYSISYLSKATKTVSDYLQKGSVGGEYIKVSYILLTNTVPNDLDIYLENQNTSNKMLIYWIDTSGPAFDPSESGVVRDHYDL